MLYAVNAQHGKSRKGAQVPSCRAHRGSSHQEICVCVFSSVAGSNPVLAKSFFVSSAFNGVVTHLMGWLMLRIPKISNLKTVKKYQKELDLAD
jgi:hypothetical protein